MRYASERAFLLLVVCCLRLPVGCGDDSTAPENGNPPPSNEPAHSWSQRFGDANEQTGYDVAIDASGNTIVVGHFWDTVDFGGGVLTAADREDIFVAKFSPSGGHLWSECFKDGKEQYAMGVAANASGDVVIIGHMYGTVDFGGGDLTSAGATDIFVATFETE